MGYQDIFSIITNAIQQALGGKSTMFLANGISLWGIFATIIVLFFGVEWMFSPSSMNGSRVVRLIIQLLICKTVLLFYVTPIYGASFTGVVINEANYITNTIGAANYDQLASAVVTVEQNTPSPTWGDIKGTMVLIIVVLFAEIIKALVFVMAAFGFIVQAILILLGPLFIPFYVVPTLDFLAWNWFKAFLQYSFFGVMGNAYAYIYTLIATALLQQITQFVSNPSMDIYTALGGLLVLMLLGLFGIIMIPMLVSHLFSGQSGASSGTTVATVAASAAL